MRGQDRQRPGFKSQLGQVMAPPWTPTSLSVNGVEKPEGPSEATESPGFCMRKLRTQRTAAKFVAEHPALALSRPPTKNQRNTHTSISSCDGTVQGSCPDTHTPWYSKALQPKKDLELRPLPTFPHDRIEKSWFNQHHGPKSDTSKWAQAMCQHRCFGTGSKVLLKPIKPPSSLWTGAVGGWAGGRG